MRNQWIIRGLLVAGLLAGFAGSARAQPNAWDTSGTEEHQIWAPIGTYQHDGSGFYTGLEFMIMKTQRIVGNQLIAIRGFDLTTGTPSFPGGGSPLTPGIEGFAPGTFLGSGQEALRSGDLGRSTWQPGSRLTFGYRMENGWNFYVSWLHLIQAQYSGGAGSQGPSFQNPGGSNQDTFLFSPVYNFSAFFVGQNPFPNPPFFVNPTNGIWNGATDMTIKFTQRFDNWDMAGRFPIFETENAQTYAIAGGRFSWFWERFEWRTVKPELITDGTSFQFQETPDSAARYENTLSQRMYGPMVGTGHNVILYSGAAGAFGASFECTGSLLVDITKKRAKYEREDDVTEAKRSQDDVSIVPNVNLEFNLTWQPFDGLTFRAGVNWFSYFNTFSMQDPVSFDVGNIDPPYTKQFYRYVCGANFGMAYTW
jgi:Legionella pneumophila major outer membrane protein precursor